MNRLLIFVFLTIYTFTYAKAQVLPPEGTPFVKLKIAGNSIRIFIAAHDTIPFWIDCGDTNITGFSQRTGVFDEFNYPFINITTKSGNVTIYGNYTELCCKGYTQSELMDLDLSYQPLLEILNCSSNKLKDLDVSKNLKLKELDCSFGILTSLNIRNNPLLERLYCYRNKIEKLDISNFLCLKDLVCYGNLLTILDVSRNKDLEFIFCSDNPIGKLDISKNNKLHALRCENNNLRKLDISNNPELEWIICDDNRISSLDCKNNPKLETIRCTNNKLTKLDLRNNPKLDELLISSKSLKKIYIHHSLDVYKFTSGIDFSNKKVEMKVDTIKNQIVFEKRKILRSSEAVNEK